MHSLILVAAVQLSWAAQAQFGDPVPGAPSQRLEQQVAVAPKSDLILQWNDVILDAIRKDRTPPPLAARNLALLHTALYESVNAIAGTHSYYLVSIKPLPGASPEAAVASAAHRILIELYPQQREDFDKALAKSLAEISEGDGKLFGKDLGSYLAGRFLGWRANDGMTQKLTYAPQAAPGVWQRTPPEFAEPLLPHWSGLTPFALDKSTRIHPQPPPGLTDARYTVAYREVKELGGSNSKARTKEQTEIAHFWADNVGTCTPPGHWNLIAQSVARERGTTLAENARLFALLNVALADVGILCWECKYKLGFWRPVTGIQYADQSGNRDTEADRTWTPLLATPPFPSYTSGHSSFSGAAATVLADFFGKELSFKSTSEGLPGVIRPFKSFWAAAEEAGQSRIYGGIHWQFDNTEGLAIGKKLAQFVCRHYLVATNPQRTTSTGGE